MVFRDNQDVFFIFMLEHMPNCFNAARMLVGVEVVVAGRKKVGVYGGQFEVGST